MNKNLFIYYWYTHLECLKNGYNNLARKYHDKATKLYCDDWEITPNGIVL